MKDILTTKEAAELLGLTTGRIRQMILDKKLPAEKFGKANLIKRADLALIKDRKNGRPRKKAA